MERKEREIIEIKPITQLNNKIKVAAYARVSSDSDDQMNSFAAQVNYYKNLIENNPKWEIADIYADEGITGVSIEKRTDFKRMLDDCKKGKINRIITKSTSRFARNTIDTLNTVRELKSLGVTIYFEKENLDTENLSSENLLTLYSLFAEEESKNISQNCKKGIRMAMSNGSYISPSVPYGYRLIDNKLVIHDEESNVVKRIFNEYLNGKGSYMIAQDLNKDKIYFKHENNIWKKQTVLKILKNERYIGDMLMQKTYTEDVIPYNKHLNRGELPQYYKYNSHEPIIERKQLELAKEIRETRNKYINKDYGIYPLTKKIICKNCRTAYRRKITNQKIYWVCREHDDNKDACCSQRILEDDVYRAFIRMYNKLIENHEKILTPMISQLERLNFIKECNNSTISNINKQIADLLQQNQVISALQAKGILDSALFISQKDEINRKLNELKKSKNNIIKAEVNDEMIENTNCLINCLKDRSDFIYEFDEIAFSQIVEKIYAVDNENIEFELINGLVIEERL